MGGSPRLDNSDTLMVMIYNVVECEGCQAVWALDYQPDACRCPNPDMVPATFHEIDAPDYRTAVGRFLGVSEHLLERARQREANR